MRAVAIGFLLTAAVSAQSMPRQGDLLVATSRTKDTAFAETVVLVLVQDGLRAVGLVLNRPLGAPASNLFPELRGKPGGAAPLWAGGPVEIGIHALLRGNVRAADGAKIAADVWLIADR